MTRQAAYQARHRAAGLCSACSRKLAPGSKVSCRIHLLARRLRERALSGSRSQAESGRGRPVLIREPRV